MSEQETIIREYLRRVEHTYRTGHATEHSYRPDLQWLLQALARGATATNEPKHRTDCGAPDYVITTGSGPMQRTIGHVEAKDLGARLADVEKTEQLGRYRRALENLVLTDYLEFRWYLKGEPQGSPVRVGALQNGRIVPDPAGIERAAQMLVTFLTRSPEEIRSPRDLAERMARLTHMIRDIVVSAFGSGSQSKDLTGLYETFKKVLIPDLSVSDFADMFAQTMAYGLFAARVRHSGLQPFVRKDAAAEIPRTNPLLRRLFSTITGPDLDQEPYAGFVDQLAELLAHADMESILRDFGRRTRQEDPIVHFYETFLAAYDPRLRELRGVYYTPEPVVSYIVRSVDALLKRDFGCAAGLADEATVVHERERGDGTREAARMPRVLLLDPACGTGTFLYAVVNEIRERFMRSGNAGMWSSYVREQLLPRLFGFELLMAPYAMAHLKLGMQLAAMDLPESQRSAWEYDFAKDERLGVFLTNTLDEAAKRTDETMAIYISDEANAASSIKRDDPVMVVFGNPPYSGHSANKGDWIMALLRGEDLTNTSGDKLLDRGKGTPTANYFAVDGQPLGERNPKWLNDDYVKFIRFAQWRIEKTGHGVLAFITNHGYLDNPTFRGMRQSLLRGFDEIYLLNLHGNSKKKERAPDGGKDENVFDIQQGVAIGIFIRRKREPGAARNATVHYADLWGEREPKYAYLAEQDVQTTAWTEVAPQAPFYLFVPRNIDLATEYEQGRKLTDAMPINVLGFQTHRDQFAVDLDAAGLRQRIADMREQRLSDEAFAQKYGLADNRDWQIASARKALRANKAWESHFVRCLYRPFDWRLCYFDEVAMDYPRTELKQHMLKPNLSLNVTRQTRADGWAHAIVANAPTPALYTEIKDGSNAFPLYLYPDLSKPVLMHDEPPPDTPGHRRANLAPEFVRDFAGRLGMAWVPDGKGDRQRTFGPEDVFSYLYAVFHSPEYRERYAEFLKIDFPRLPLTDDPALFRALCSVGDRLVALHLMEARAEPLTRYPVPGENRVERVRYTAPGEGAPVGRVWINDTQYIEGVPPEVWEFHIGGYQVCEKWLKDRKGRTLTYDDLAHYQAVVAALAETRTLMEAIDEAIEEHGGWPLAGSAAPVVAKTDAV